MKKLGELLAGFYQNITLPLELKNTEIAGLTLDSRQASATILFIALKGQHADGRDFIDACSANVIVAQANKESVVYQKNKVIISLVQLPEKVSALASRFYNDPSQKIALTAFTGTNGKTTCAYLYAQLVANLAGFCGHVGTLGFGVFSDKKNDLVSTGLTTPSAIDCQKILSEFCEKTQYAAMEVSSHALVQHRVKNMRFSGAVFTNLSRDHLDYHKTMSAYFEAKLTLFTNHSIDFAVANIDDEYGKKILNKLHSDVSRRVKTLGFSIEQCDLDTINADDVIYVQNVSFTSQGMDVEIAGSFGQHRFFTPLIGSYNLANVLAVIACAVLSGFDIEKICRAVAAFKPVVGRLEPVARLDNQVSVFVDFAHTPDAVEKVIKELRAICKGQLWVVLGCGGNRDQGKRPLMAQAALTADYSIFTSDNPRDEPIEIILDDMLMNISTSQYVHRIASRKKAIAYAIAQADPNDIVLIAGKGHERHQIIQGEYIPFNDHDIAKNILETMGKTNKQSEVMHAK